MALIRGLPEEGRISTAIGPLLAGSVIAARSLRDRLEFRCLAPLRRPRGACGKRSGERHLTRRGHARRSSGKRRLRAAGQRDRGLGASQAAWALALSQAGAPWSDAVVSGFALYGVTLAGALLFGGLATFSARAPDQARRRKASPVPSHDIPAMTRSTPRKMPST